MDRGYPPEIVLLEALFSDHNFVTFEVLQQVTGLDRRQIVALKPVLESRLREDDKNIRLTSLMYLSSPGLFVES